MLAEVINSGIQPLQNLKVLKALGEKKEEWARTVISDGFSGDFFIIYFYFFNRFPKNSNKWILQISLLLIKTNFF